MCYGGVNPKAFQCCKTGILKWDTSWSDFLLAAAEVDPRGTDGLNL